MKRRKLEATDIPTRQSSVGSFKRHGEDDQGRRAGEGRRGDENGLQGLTSSERSLFHLLGAPFSDSEDGLRRLPSTFSSWTEYAECFRPMVVEELASVLRTESPVRVPRGVRVVGVEVKGKIAMLTLSSSLSGNEMLRIRGSSPQGMGRNALVSLSPSSSAFGHDLTATSSLPPLYGVVTQVSFGSGGCSLDCLVRLAAWLSFVQSCKGDEKSSWPPSPTLHLHLHTNVVTGLREVMALDHLRSSPLLSTLLSAQPSLPPPAAVSAIQSAAQSLPPNFASFLTRTYNASQLEAVLSVLSSSAFCLIQGPPGTGKTTTLLGLVNSLHLRAYNNFYDSLLTRVPGQEEERKESQRGNEETGKVGGEKGGGGKGGEGGEGGRKAAAEAAVRRPPPLLQWLLSLSTTGAATHQPVDLATALPHVEEAATRLKPRLLVTAPSNAATDSVLEKIVRSGFCDGGGNR